MKIITKTTNGTKTITGYKAFDGTRFGADKRDICESYELHSIAKVAYELYKFKWNKEHFSTSEDYIEHILSTDDVLHNYTYKDELDFLRDEFNNAEYMYKLFNYDERLIKVYNRRCGI